MSMQSQNHTATTRQDESSAKPFGNGTICDAQHDADVSDMIAAEIAERTAALRAMIAEAAYFRAEQRGFEAGHEVEDWLAAEEEIGRRLQEEGWPRSSE